MRTSSSVALNPVVFNATLEEVLNLIGTFVFAVSGALLAFRKHYHIVSMAALAEITAIGGVVIHDLVIGAVPRWHSPMRATSGYRSWPQV